MARDYTRTMPIGLSQTQRRLYSVHLDYGLLLALSAIVGFGLLVLNSAARGDTGVLGNQIVRMGLALAVMLLAAQINPRLYRRWTPAIYVAGIVLLVAVLLFGEEVKGGKRWLDLPGLPRFQPSELMKLAVPMATAWFLHEQPSPLRFHHLLLATAVVAVPAVLVAAQPDLGTGVMVAAGGLSVLVLSGIRWRLIAGVGVLAALAMPLLWMVMLDYQKARVLTMFNPERDPLGAGWNIIQSKTAIGSGGLEGKGLFAGTQSQLDFLPESRTDFIFAVIGEELGLIGVTLMLGLYLVVIARALFIASQASDTFGRLTAGGLTLVFFAYVFVNIAMVSGLLPVVGVPLPLVSYGGTSAITLLAGFGIVMSIHTHRSG